MSEVQRMVPRVVEADENTQLFTATHATLSLPAPLHLVDAAAVMPGLGEHQRVIRAVQAWQSHPNMKHLIVSGTNKNEVEQPQLTLERLQQQPFMLERKEDVLTQVSAEHTRLQTDWIIDQMLAHKVRSLALFVSHWHMPRAYRTLLKSMLNADLKLPIVPVTVGSSPRSEVPEYHKTVESLSAGEAIRIAKYQEIGEISSYDELMDYLEWLWNQNLLPLESDT